MVRKNPKTPINTHINRYLYVKVYGRGLNQLVGYRWLCNNFDPVLLEKTLDKVFNSNLDKVVFKFRRGIKVTFYAR